MSISRSHCLPNIANTAILIFCGNCAIFINTKCRASTSSTRCPHTLHLLRSNVVRSNRSPKAAVCPKTYAETNRCNPADNQTGAQLVNQRQGRLPKAIKSSPPGSRPKSIKIVGTSALDTRHSEHEFLKKSMGTQIGYAT